jgi:hypothetical protein
MKLYLIEWDDTHTEAEWVSTEIDLTTAKCWTIGTILKETDSYVEVIASRCIGGMKLQMIAIPKGCITRMRRIHI